MTILSVIATVCAIIYGAQKALVTASSRPIADAAITAAGPSQFYAQHNLVSDGFVPADHLIPML